MRLGSWLVLAWLVSFGAFAGVSRAENSVGRHVDGGYLSFDGEGEDVNREVALFMARASAVHGIVLECTLPPRDIRLEKFEHRLVGERHHYHGRAAVPFQDCEEAKNAVTPEVIRKLTHPQLARDQEKYEKLIFRESEGPGARVELSSLKRRLSGSAAATSEFFDLRLRVMASSEELRNQELADRALSEERRAAAIEGLRRLRAAESLLHEQRRRREIAAEHDFTCEKAGARSCYTLGRAALSFSDVDQAREYFRRGCKLGDERACDKAKSY